MFLALSILFWLCASCLVFSYFVYPQLLKLLSRGKQQNQVIYTLNEVPGISIVIAAYNEEKVIAQKIESIFNTNFPTNKIEVLIGSDNSKDKTNDIINSYCKKYSQIQFFAYTERNGKPNILNKLVPLAKNEIIVLTDANVYFDENTLYETAKHFKNTDIGLVGVDVINTGLKEEGISHQETLYIKNETLAKYREGLLWGSMMGPFGACYAMRKSLFSAIPPNFIVDDFYLCMKVYEAKKQGIIELNAKCYEDVSNILKEEYRRKARISTGNFQNLVIFKKLLNFRRAGLSFSFLSHKVLRWIGPFFIITCFITNGLLALDSEIYFWFFVLQALGIFGMLFDFSLKLVGIHLKLLRLLTHFYSMNLALLVGFFRYISGRHNAMWTPTQRNQ